MFASTLFLSLSHSIFQQFAAFDLAIIIQNGKSVTDTTATLLKIGSRRIKKKSKNNASQQIYTTIDIMFHLQYVIKLSPKKKKEKK